LVYFFPPMNPLEKIQTIATSEIIPARVVTLEAILAEIAVMNDSPCKTTMIAMMRRYWTILFWVRFATMFYVLPSQLLTNHII